MADRNDLPLMLAQIKLRFQTSIVITYKRANMWTDGCPMHHDVFQVELSVVGQVKVIDVWWLWVTVSNFTILREFFLAYFESSIRWDIWEVRRYSCNANATCYEAVAGGLGTPANINRLCGWDASTWPKLTQPSLALSSPATESWNYAYLTFDSSQISWYQPDFQVRSGYWPMTS